jgi:hypothetical protein
MLNPPNITVGKTIRSMPAKRRDSLLIIASMRTNFRNLICFVCWRWHWNPVPESQSRKAGGIRVTVAPVNYHQAPILALMTLF